MIYLQIIVTLFTVAVLYKMFKQRQQGKISIAGFLVWFILWLAVLIAFWQPETTTYLANWLGIGRGADLVLYVSVLVIFYLLFKIFVKLNKIDDNITKIVRKDAIKNARDKR